MDPAVSPLRQRMIEDMRMRKLEAKTQQAYVRAIVKRGAFLGRSPAVRRLAGSLERPLSI